MIVLTAIANGSHTFKQAAAIAAAVIHFADRNHNNTKPA